MKNRKIAILISTCIFMLSQNFVVFANTASDLNNTFSINSLSNMLQSIDCFENIEQDKNSITYMVDGEQGEIIILENNDEIEKIQFTEGDKVDILEYDKINDKLYSNGVEITVNEKTVNSNIKRSLGSKFDEKYRDISLEKKIYDYTKAALAGLLCWAFKIPNGGATFIASTLIAECINAGYASSKAVYCYSYKRMESDYTKYRSYWYTYWDPDYEDFCEKYYQDFLNQGN